MEKIIFSLMLSSQVFEAGPKLNDALESLIVDAVLAKVSITGTVDDVKNLPDAVRCGKQSVEGLRKIVKDIAVNVDSDKTVIRYDESDGDQVNGFLARTSDLEALASGKEKQITAKFYSAF